MKRAVALLYVQATIWALLTVGLIASGSADLERTPARKVTAAVVCIVLALLTGTFALAKVRFAYRLPRGSDATREAVIRVEALMACFACLVLLALAITVFGLILSPPFIVGGIVSAYVAHDLTKPPARHHFEACPAG